MNSQDKSDSSRLIRRLKDGTQPGDPHLAAEVDRISAQQGVQAAFNFLLRAEVALGLRRPSLAVYDHAFHLIGGAQKYGLTLTSALRDLFDITILTNKEIHLEDFGHWYGLDLSGCAVKVIRLPFYEAKGAAFLDPAFVSTKVENPFHLISRESGNYDIFLNNSMNEMVFPLANVSVFICHFPERLPRSYFYVDRYSHIVYNSRYTREWIEKMWNLSPREHIYPPVDLENAGAGGAKKKLILSVARFEPEGTKRQREMIEAFLKLDRLYPEIIAGWKFVLAGGSEPKNAYLEGLNRRIAGLPRRNVELKINIPAAELRSLYEEASIFWHLCGIVHDHPSEVEHFGMTTVEAMQNRAVPIVYDGGGLREIVDDGWDGFLVRTKARLLEKTIALIRDPGLRGRLGDAAQRKAQRFSRAEFEARVRAFFGRILSDYSQP